MTLLEVTGRRKLPVWRTVRACYATVLRNLRQLVRISWLWLLIMIPVYAAAYWFALLPSEPRLVRLVLAKLPFVVELPFLASIAVAWHRLVLRREQMTARVFLRLDSAVGAYALCSFAFLVLGYGPIWGFQLFFTPEIAHGAQLGLLPPSQFAVLVLSLAAALVVSLVICLLVVPRLSLVLPALALGERLSLRQAWSITRANALRLALATSICMLPVAVLVVFPVLPALPFMFGDASEWHVALDLINELLRSLVYRVLVSLGYAVLTIFAVTLLSMAYGFFTELREESASPAA